MENMVKAFGEALAPAMKESNHMMDLKKPVVRCKEKPEYNCEFCGQAFKYRKEEMINQKFWIRPTLCSCNQAQEAHKQQEQEKWEAEERKQASKRQMEIEKLFRSSQLPDRFRSRTFENFKINKQNDDAYKKSVVFSENFKTKKEEGSGLWFGGNVGTGKTHLASAITKTLLQQRYSVIFGTPMSLLGRIRQSYNSDSKIKDWQIIQHLIECDLLVIDDFGKENVTSWVEEKLFEIINARYEGNQPLIVTTNVNKQMILKRYQQNGEAIFSRITEMCEPIICDWKDYRMGEDH